MLVAAFRGWNDGAQGASLALGFLAQAWTAERFADIDPEEFFDFQVTRPHVALVDGVTRRVDWPETAFFHAPLPGRRPRRRAAPRRSSRTSRWRTFTSEIVELAQELGVELVVTLGALLADVPHTRPAPVTGSATDPELVEELGLAASRYEGPTGIVGVLHDACRDGRDPVGEPLGRGPALRVARRQPEGGARALLPVRRAPRRGRSTSPSSSARRRPTSARSARRWPQDEETEAYVRELEERRDALGDELDAAVRATRSPPS